MFNFASRKFFLDQGQPEKFYEGGINAYSISNGGTASFSRTFYNYIEGDDWIDIAGGGEWMLAIKDNGQGTTSGTLWTWGQNGRWSYDGWPRNALGLGSYKHYATAPTQVGTADNWTNVWATMHVSYGLKSDGTIWAWGDPYSSGCGALGLSATNLGVGASFPTQIGTADNWTSMFSAGGGGFFTKVVAINQDGELYGWGENLQGELGLGDTTHRGIPTSLTGSTGWTTAVAGNLCAFAIKDGYIYGTGKNNWGQLGIGDTTNRTTWTQITGPSFTDVTSTNLTTYAIKSDGTLWGWGYGPGGWLPNSTTSYTPVQIGIDTNWEKFLGTQNFYSVMASLVKKTNGEVYVIGAVNAPGTLSLYQTGYDSSAMFSPFISTTVVNTNTALQALGSYAGYTDQVGDPSLSIGITKGARSTWSGHILKNGRIYSCGSNTNYGFGTGTEHDIKVRGDYTGFYGILNGLSWSNGTSNNILFLVKNDGTLWVVGEYWSNADPTGSNNLSGSYFIATQYYEPTQVGTDTFWKDVLSFISHTPLYSAVIKSDGTYWNTGARNNTNPYSNETSNVAIWTQAGSDSDWEWITSGYLNFYAKKGGYLYAWGENSNGQLGLGDNTDRYNSGIYQVDSNSWTKVAPTQNSAIGLRTDGTIWATGDGVFGETGLGSETDVNTFTQIGTADNWTDISRTNQTTIALNSSGEIWQWGIYSKIYFNNVANWTPSKVNDDTDWVKIFSSRDTNYAVKSDGSIWVIAGRGKEQPILSSQVLQGINGDQWVTYRPQKIVSSSDAPTENIKIAAWGSDKIAYIK